jgi:hypothetical protein
MKMQGYAGRMLPSFILIQITYCNVFRIEKRVVYQTICFLMEASIYPNLTGPLRFRQGLWTIKQKKNRTQQIRDAQKLKYHSATSKIGYSLDLKGAFLQVT